MIAVQAVVELMEMVPAFVWMALVSIIALLIVLTVITTKKAEPRGGGAGQAVRRFERRLLR